MIYKFIRKYLGKSRSFLKKGNIVYKTEYSTVFLPKFSDTSHKMLETMAREVQGFCKEKGYPVEKVVFFSGYIADIHDEKKLTKRASMDTDSYLAIKEDNDGKFVAILFEGSTVCFEYFER